MDARRESGGTPGFRLTGVVLDAPDARELAGFYRRLLGWQVLDDEPDWVRLAPPGGGTGLSFQSEPAYLPPVWPSGRERQQMMLHLDIRVDELASATAHALDAGATLAAFQPQDDVRVLLDPAGHPFCLWTEPEPPERA
ncbi:VOC family protein [Streptomyces sp. 3MP-14]|uniref:VOC family protein n=1 Tax=Streptomyces mimosae TaxID=2586635 RepID=A0A5N6AS21_9ACTN|nr:MULTISPECIES: VOC family protein [Streptomyces]KAB8170896.1 VOC family protein [Streptomyces mimosae]KAB8179753.1 VOC family protein [Streptomyces sp. 3MP-14]